MKHQSKTLIIARALQKLFISKESMQHYKEQATKIIEFYGKDVIIFKVPHQSTLQFCIRMRNIKLRSARNYHLGDFMVCLFPNSGDSIPQVYFRNIHPKEEFHKDFWKSEIVIHPHISDTGRACYSGYYSILAQLIHNGLYLPFFQVIDKFLRTWSIESPFWYLKDRYRQNQDLISDEEITIIHSKSQAPLVTQFLVDYPTFWQSKFPEIKSWKIAWGYEVIGQMCRNYIRCYPKSGSMRTEIQIADLLASTKRISPKTVRRLARIYKINIEWDELLNGQVLYNKHYFAQWNQLHYMLRNNQFFDKMMKSEMVVYLMKKLMSTQSPKIETIRHLFNKYVNKHDLIQNWYDKIILNLFETSIEDAVKTEIGSYLNTLNNQLTKQKGDLEHAIKHFKERTGKDRIFFGEISKSGVERARVVSNNHIEF